MMEAGTDPQLPDSMQEVAAAAGCGDAAVIAGWVENLDHASTVALFELALFEHLDEVIDGRPALRNALLSAYVERW